MSGVQWKTRTRMGNCAQNGFEDKGSDTQGNGRAGQWVSRPAGAQACRHKVRALAQWGV